MLKKITLLFLLVGLNSFAQETTKYISKKGIYEIAYNPKHCKQLVNADWDVEFTDTYNLINAYFMEFDYFMAEKELKETIKSQYEEFGKVKKLKIYKKKISTWEVDYFECQFEYNNTVWKYEGFIYNGKGGAIEFQFGYQLEGYEHVKGFVEEMLNGISEVKE